MRAQCHAPHREKEHDDQRPQDPRPSPKRHQFFEDRVSQQSGRPLQDAIIFEIFSGTARVSTCLPHFGLSSAFGIDDVRPKNWCAPISLLDLTAPKGRTLLRKWLNNPGVVGIFLAPPCGTASRAGCIKFTRKREGPPPLRSDEFLNGLQNLSFVDKIKTS